MNTSGLHPIASNVVTFLKDLAKEQETSHIKFLEVCQDKIADNLLKIVWVLSLKQKAACHSSGSVQSSPAHPSSASSSSASNSANGNSLKSFFSSSPSSSSSESTRSSCTKSHTTLSNLRKDTTFLKSFHDGDDSDDDFVPIASTKKDRTPPPPPAASRTSGLVVFDLISRLAMALDMTEWQQVEDLYIEPHSDPSVFNSEKTNYIGTLTDLKDREVVDIIMTIKAGEKKQAPNQKKEDSSSSSSAVRGPVDTYWKFHSNNNPDYIKNYPKNLSSQRAIISTGKGKNESPEPPPSLPPMMAKLKSLFYHLKGPDKNQTSDESEEVRSINRLMTSFLAELILTPRQKDGFFNIFYFILHCFRDCVLEWKTVQNGGDFQLSVSGFDRIDGWMIIYLKNISYAIRAKKHKVALGVRYKNIADQDITIQKEEAFARSSASKKNSLDDENLYLQSLFGDPMDTLEEEEMEEEVPQASSASSSADNLNFVNKNGKMMDLTKGIPCIDFSLVINVSFGSDDCDEDILGTGEEFSFRQRASIKRKYDDMSSDSSSSLHQPMPASKRIKITEMVD